MPGSKGQSKGKVHDTFRNNVEQLQKDANNLSRATTGLEQRKWQIGPLTAWDGNVLNVPGITPKYDRAEIGNNYSQCLADPVNPGTTADTQALTLQSDWLAMQERAFRLRHATSVRTAIHAAGRRLGHADDRGVIRTGVLKYVEDIIKRGA